MYHLATMPSNNAIDLSTGQIYHTDITMKETLAQIRLHWGLFLSKHESRICDIARSKR
jgi:hypothetical protein